MTGRSSPIAFEERGAGRWVALLGVWEVGEVTPFPGGGKHQAHWRVAPMHDAAVSEKRRFPARDVPEAKRRLEQHLLDWIEGSGLQFVPRPEIRAFRAAESRLLKSCVMCGGPLAEGEYQVCKKCDIQTG